MKASLWVMNGGRVFGYLGEAAAENEDQIARICEETFDKWKQEIEAEYGIPVPMWYEGAYEVKLEILISAQQSVGEKK